MILEISLGKFYSCGDERRLFHGPNEISAIRGMKGVGRILLLDMDVELLDNEEMREPIGLLCRYGIPLAPLRAFAKMKKFAWLFDSEKFWHKNIFNDPASG